MTERQIIRQQGGITLREVRECGGEAKVFVLHMGSPRRRERPFRDRREAIAAFDHAVA